MENFPCLLTWDIHSFIFIFILHENEKEIAKKLEDHQESKKQAGPELGQAQPRWGYGCFVEIGPR